MVCGRGRSTASGTSFHQFMQWSPLASSHLANRRSARALYRLLGAVGHCSNHCFAFIAVGSGNKVRKLCKWRTCSMAVLGARPASRQSSSNSSSSDFQCDVMCLAIAYYVGNHLLFTDTTFSKLIYINFQTT